MPYIPLGSRLAPGASDTTGLNTGNYTNYFPASALNVTVPFYEVYYMTVTGLAVVATVTVYVSSKVRSTAKLLGNSDWDPNQPILLIPGDDLALAWDFGAGAAPSAAIWLRYDPTAQAA